MKGSSGRYVAMTFGLLGILLAGQIVRLRLAESAVLNRDGALAASVRPQNGWGRGLLAAALFDRGEVKAAQSESLAAIRDTPLSVVALRTLARTQERLNGAGSGEQAWQAASLLGWRDRPTQLWAMLRAISNGETEIFTMRADALLRAGDRTDTTASFIRKLMLAPQLRGPFADRVALDPPWRSSFFLPPAALVGRDLEGSYLLLRDLRGKPNPPRRADLRNTVAGLIREGRFSEAVSLDGAFLRRQPDAGSLIDDGG